MTTEYKTLDDFFGHHLSTTRAGVFEVAPIEKEVVHIILDCYALHTVVYSEHHGTSVRCSMRGGRA